MQTTTEEAAVFKNLTEPNLVKWRALNVDEIELKFSTSRTLGDVAPVWTKPTYGPADFPDTMPFVAM